MKPCVRAAFATSRGSRESPNSPRLEELTLALFLAPVRVLLALGAAS